MEEEKRIVYKAGITRTPSDFLCQDGELAECINLVTDHEELKPMVEPEPFIIDARTRPAPQGVEIDVPKILYVHRYNNESRYVGYVVDANGDKLLLWGTVDSLVFYLQGYFKEPDGTFLKYTGGAVTSIGKTLIYSASDGLHYYVWKLDEYDNVSLSLPEIKFKALLKYVSHFENSGSIDGMVKTLDGDDDLPAAFRKLAVQDGKQDKYNDLVVGLYAKNLKSIASAKLFCEPFFVRAALEMYDGTYIYITNPVLLFPSVRMNSYGFVDEDNLCVRTSASRLFIMQEQDFTKYSDIVKDIVIFASKGVAIYNTDTDQPLANPTLPSQEVFNYADAVSFTGQNVGQSSQCEYNLRVATTYTHLVDDVLREEYAYRVLSQREDEDILRDIESTSQFYKICSLGLKPTNGWISAGEKIPDYVLPNLTTQPRLEYDDYFSRNKLTAEVLYPYNARLNLAGVKRGLFEGFDFFMPLYNNSTAGNDYWFYVKIQIDNGEQVWVMHRASSSQVQGVYFFYPDPRAKHVTVYNQTTGHFVLDAELKEHPMLNGAYYLRELPTAETGEIIVPVSADGFTYNNNYKEFLPNYIVTSEVNNPWVFQAEGYNRVGTGKIIGMSTVTQALSQGQFGQYPLLVFSESGIWALSVDGTGLYQGMSPMSREVCINKRSIIQTDGAVFFASKKGLMVITGSDVRCVSERMNGEAFNYEDLIKFERDVDDPDDPRYPWKAMIVACQRNWTLSQFLRSPNLIMAYDYMDSRIIISDPTYDTFSYVYNIADGSFSKMVLQMSIDNAVNDYPDYLLQGMVTVTVDDEQVRKNHVFSLYNKSPEDGMVFRRLGFLLTRPMKLGGPVTVTSLRQLMNVGRWDKSSGSLVKTEAFVSSDLSEWYPLGSRFGAAAKFFRLALYVKMKPLERLSGTILTVQNRRENNMR